MILDRFGGKKHVFNARIVPIKNFFLGYNNKELFNDYITTYKNVRENIIKHAKRDNLDIIDLSDVLQAMESKIEDFEPTIEISEE